MDADLVAIIKMQTVFGKHANLVWAYCELFGISPLKARRKKLRVLLEEMKALFVSGSFSYQKKTYRIGMDAIADALNLIVHKHFETNLENHNYLKKVMISIAEKESRGEGARAEADLRKREQSLRSRPADPEKKEEFRKPLGMGDFSNLIGRGGRHEGS